MQLWQQINKWKQTNKPTNATNKQTNETPASNIVLIAQPMIIVTCVPTWNSSTPEISGTKGSKTSRIIRHDIYLRRRHCFIAECQITITPTMGALYFLVRFPNPLATFMAVGEPDYELPGLHITKPQMHHTNARLTLPSFALDHRRTASAVGLHREGFVCGVSQFVCNASSRCNTITLHHITKAPVHIPDISQ